ncbi:MAG TPA: ABC transporter permease [Pyrinomonadaceae bacterium]|jgi:lipopolysaccharide transport system permease protein
MVSNTSTGSIETALGAQEDDATASPRRTTVIRPPSISLKGLAGDLRKLWRYRDLLYTLSVHRIKVRYKQSLLGVSWAVLQPLALMLIYTVIFSVIAKVETGRLPYTLFAFAGLLPWTYFSTSLTNATSGLVSHSQLITKVYFPREILPLTYVFAALFDFLIAACVLALMMIYHAVAPSLHALYLVPIMLVLTCFATASAFFFSATQVRFRDIGVAMPLLLQLWMFATPVVYPLAAVPARFRPLYQLNPMAGIIENFRRVLLEAAPPDFASLGLSAGVALVLLAASYVYFKHVEATIADIV